MTQTQQYCSTPEQLDFFLRGQLSVHEESELQLHLNDCVLCRERLENAAADVSAWSEAKQFFGNGALYGTFEDSTSGHEEATQGELRIRQVLDALCPTDDPESLGRIGGYEVSGVVGAGGMGVVLKAHDRSLDRIVAIKVMSPHLSSSSSARKRFAREAKAAAAVLHPNVIAIHSVASEEANPFLVMPYVRGASLQKRIDSNGNLPLKDTLRIGAQIAAGLAAAHNQGLVHRDIKPANILLEEGVERVTITDFGLARAVDDASMTCSGIIAGTPQYMSPEQARGEAIDARSDLFSLGSVLYAMCTGRPPYRAETTYGVLHRIANEHPTSVCEVNSDVPDWLGHIVQRLMAKRPEGRFESAAQVAELLEGCLAHVQQPAAIPLPEAVAELAPRRTRRPPIGKIIGVAAGAFAIFFAGILIVLELNKGTLTIESDLEGVPVRVRQGERIVDQMTVTKSGNSIRVAAGTYVVELETKLDGMVVENDQVTLKRGATEHVKIRLSTHDAQSNTSSSKMHFETPEALMKYVADCQARGDIPGVMDCWSDQLIEEFARSYLFFLTLQLKEYRREPLSHHPPGYAEQMEKLKQIFAEELADEDTTTSALAHQTDRLKNPRSFVKRMFALNQGEFISLDGKKVPPRIYAYTVQQYGDKAVATETTDHTKFGLIKTNVASSSGYSVSWRINELSNANAQDGSAALQGDWEYISVESEGVIREYKTLETQPSTARLTISADRWEVKSGGDSIIGSDLGSASHRVSIDGDKLTLYGTTSSMPGLGSSEKISTIGYGLFKIDGDTLTYLVTPAMALHELNGQVEMPIKRPETFETKGTRNNVFRLRRMDASDGNSKPVDPNTSRFEQKSELQELKQEISDLREQRLNDQLFSRLSGRWEQLDVASSKLDYGQADSIVWRLTTEGNCDRHLIGGEVSIIVLGELTVDAAQEPNRIAFRSTGPDGVVHVQPGIVRFRASILEIVLSRKIFPANEIPPEYPQGFDKIDESVELFRLVRPDTVPLIETIRMPVQDSTLNGKPTELNALEARTLDDVTSVYNQQTRQMRNELFNPPITDLTTDQMKAALLDAADQYRKQGRVEIASALKASAETNRLAERLTFMGMSGAMPEGFRQITPTFRYEVASNSSLSIVLRKAELRYSPKGWSSKAWGDIHPPITGKWELVSVEHRGETLTQEAFKDWRQEHAGWTELNVDSNSLTMAGENAEKFEFAIDQDTGALPQYAMRKDGNTKYSGVWMANGFVDNTTLVFAVDIGGGSTPKTFDTKDGKKTNLTYRRVERARIAATANEAYESLDRLVRNPKMDRKTSDRSVAVVATRMTSDIEFSKYVLTQFQKACAGGESTYQARRHLLAALTSTFHAWGQRRWRTESKTIQQFGSNGPIEAWLAAAGDLELEVLESVANYGRKATRSDIVEFARATRALHHPDSQPFLRDILLNNQATGPSPFAPTPSPQPTSKHSVWSDNFGGTWIDAGFVAAVGLAELGDQNAVEWLLAKAKPNDFGLDESIYFSRHLRDSRGSLRESSRCALTDLFGQPADWTEAQLRNWWMLNRSRVNPRRVRLQCDTEVRFTLAAGGEIDLDELALDKSNR
jgi:Protein kinase domain